MGLTLVDNPHAQHSYKPQKIHSDVLDVLLHKRPFASVINHYAFDDLTMALDKAGKTLLPTMSIDSTVQVLKYLMFGEEVFLKNACLGVDIFKSIHCLGKIDDWQNSHWYKRVNLLRQVLIEQLQDNMGFISDLSPLEAQSSLISNDVTQQGLWIDKKPLSHNDYYRFLQATGQSDKDKVVVEHIRTSNIYDPVSHISEEKAREYGAWAGKSHMPLRQRQQFIFDAPSAAEETATDIETDLHYFYIEDVDVRTWG
jgi:formylglycine-generating enzyme required for sulfatase activity